MSSVPYEAYDLRVTVAARAFLEALAKGHGVDHLADELAGTVLAPEAIQAALAVTAGGEFKWRRAVELAGLVLAQQRGVAKKGTGVE